MFIDKFINLNNNVITLIKHLIKDNKKESETLIFLLNMDFEYLFSKETRKTN